MRKSFFGYRCFWLSLLVISSLLNLKSTLVAGDGIVRLKVESSECVANGIFRFPCKHCHFYYEVTVPTKSSAKRWTIHESFGKPLYSSTRALDQFYTAENLTIPFFGRWLPQYPIRLHQWTFYGAQVGIETYNGTLSVDMGLHRSVSRQLTLHNLDRTRKLVVKAEVVCNRNFYASCSTYCREGDSLSAGHFRCNMSGQRVCLPGWAGTHCSQRQKKSLRRTRRQVGMARSHAMSDCPLECGMGGVCLLEREGGMESSAYCKCERGITGQRCDEDLDECQQSFEYLDQFTGVYYTKTGPCAFESTCVNTLGSYECFCPPLYRGKHCEEMVSLSRKDILEGLNVTLIYEILLMGILFLILYNFVMEISDYRNSLHHIPDIRQILKRLNAVQTPVQIAVVDMDLEDEMENKMLSIKQHRRELREKRRRDVLIKSDDAPNKAWKLDERRSLIINVGNGATDRSLTTSSTTIAKDAVIDGKIEESK